MRIFQIIVDGQAWEDADGNDQFGQWEVDSLVAHIESQGYDDIQVVEL